MSSKRRRLGNHLDLIHRGGVTVQGLAALLVATGAETMTVGGLRNKMRDATKAELNKVLACSRLPLKDGTDWVWHFMDPGKLLQTLLAESPSLRQLVSTIWSRSPCTLDSPWSLVVGFDEFIPGNKLSTDQSRKTMVLSFSFMEMERCCSSVGATWFTPVVVRSNTIAQVLVQSLHLSIDNGAYWMSVETTSLNERHTLGRLHFSPRFVCGFWPTILCQLACGLSPRSWNELAEATHRVIWGVMIVVYVGGGRVAAHDEGLLGALAVRAAWPCHRWSAGPD